MAGQIESCKCSAKVKAVMGDVINADGSARLHTCTHYPQGISMNAFVARVAANPQVWNAVIDQAEASGRYDG